MTDTMAKKGGAGAGDFGSDYDSRYGFRDDERNYDFKSKKGLDHEIVEMISRYKKEPAWMRELRHQALDTFLAKPMPKWGSTELLDEIEFDNIHYYVRASDKKVANWEELDPAIKRTYDKLGVPEAERKFLAGVTAQYESEVVYHSIRADLEKLGVQFTDMDTGLREHEDVVRKYFGTVIPAADNKFAALNTAVWSGGSFVYVPTGVMVVIQIPHYFG